MADKLWKELKKRKTLLQGWHLARLDERKDYIQDIYTVDMFANKHEERINDIQNRLETDSYDPKALLTIDVPKPNLSIRPGAKICIDDKVVLSAIILLIAPILDNELPDSVYSFRVRKDLTNLSTEGLFNEQEQGVSFSRLIAQPYLKQSTITNYIDAFDPWHYQWPEFDEQSKKFSQEYEFLVVSDITAYFENIQIPILRDRLYNLLNGEHRIVNLLCSFLERWAFVTDTGRIHLRGIPQPNFISSFLANIFLLPLDEHFERMSKNKSYDIKYLRYMDDTRIFTNDKIFAQQCLMQMDSKLRLLHLNTQSSKTKIYQGTEIKELFYDERLDMLNEKISLINNLKKDNNCLTEEVIKDTNRLLTQIGRKKVSSNRQKLFGSRKPFKDLDSRVFRRWITLHFLIEKSSFIPKLTKEIKRNPGDLRLFSILTNSAKRFPLKQKDTLELFRLLEQEYFTYGFQKAELIKTFRYLSQIDNEIIDYCHKTLCNRKEDAYYLKMQCAYLLTRVILTKDELKMYTKLFSREKNLQVKASIAALLLQSNDNFDNTLMKLSNHSNYLLSQMGINYKYYIDNYAGFSNLLNHIKSQQADYVLCDYLPHMYVISMSKVPQIIVEFEEFLGDIKDTCKIVGLRDTLNHIYKRIRKRCNDVQGNAR